MKTFDDVGGRSPSVPHGSGSSPGADPILEIRGITKNYPGVCALNNVSFAVQRGQVHALMGENGAGKSTLIKIICGAVPATAGGLSLDGQAVERLTPALAMKLGIGVIYQEFNNAASLSVVENVFLGRMEGGRLCPDWKIMRRRAAELFEMLGVSIPLDVPVGTLSVAQQQIVEIARALSQNVKVLIMDEPTATLAIAEAKRLFRIIRHLKSQGVTVIYISHRMEEVFELADSITVLRDGRHIRTCPMSELSRHDLITLMVGRELSETYPKRSSPIGEPVLEVRHLCGPGAKDVSFTLHKGEVLGLAGLIGAGRTETAKIIYGTARRTSGQVLLHGRPVHFLSAGQALYAGVGYISESRKADGIFLDFPIDWNISVSALKRHSRLSVVDTKAVQRVVAEMAARFRIKAPSMSQLVSNLSGGNQQKVSLAKVLALDTDIVIFDEPTRGSDVGVKQEVYLLMNELVQSGVSILMISSEMEELMGMSDRIVVLHEGVSMAALERSEFDQNHILSLASGIAEKEAANG